MKIKQIIFTNSSDDTLKEILQHERYTKIAVLVDENTFEHCLPIIHHDVSHPLVIKIKSGEINKTLATCSHVWQELTNHHFDRKSLLINLGGGIIGDLGGFCAATFKRGIDFINIPTTLLSQVDASIGGKLGVDFNGLKNHIGLFKEPKNIIIDQQFLATLPKRELRSGFAEVVKHHLIADKVGWEQIRTTPFDSLSWKEVVHHSVKIKEYIVKEDPLEDGLRKVLNFGHTVGHAVESYLLNSGKAILHGEAIAMGMICEAFISYKHQLLSAPELNQITEFILPIYGKILLDNKDKAETLKYLIQDKKNKDSTIMAVLLKGIGEVVWDQPINGNQCQEAFQYYEEL